MRQISFSQKRIQPEYYRRKLAHGYTQFCRNLMSLKKDMAVYDERIGRETKRWFVAIGKRIADCEKMLLACDPRLKLKQGFSIVTDGSGRIIKSSRAVAVSDIIRVRLYEGILESKVEEVK